MSHKQHSSWNRRAKPRKAAPSPQAQQAQSQRRIADGQSRPMPGLTPPLREDAWVEQRVAAQKALEEADRQARQGTPEEPAE
ncbi:hypothetical protein OIA45_49135 (plasmid) [Streptomyces chartreusis]|uniref:hypothetical protein n=1 Tax=Streptomyces chartreusis TaxID=1969 RepID=UPI00387059C2|nr:hypothetical protein OIA45_49135 [Streptomyces chartreusis]